MRGADRNKPCWCGSGRKQKKCHPGPTKPRETRINLDFGTPVALAGIGIDSQTGEVQFLDDTGRQLRPTRVESEVGYQGETKSKTTSRIDLVADGPVNLSLEANLIQFDRIYAADTTPSAEHAGVAVMALSAGRARRVGGELTYITFEPCAMLEFHGLHDINPELAGWATVVDLIRTSADYDPSWSIGLISDTELGQMSAFNERLAPIVGAIFLPHNFRMHYAGDATGDTVLNRAIRVCDDLSRRATGEVLREPARYRRTPPPDVPCGWWRLWIRKPPAERALFTVTESSARVDSRFRLSPSSLWVPTRRL